MEKPAFPTGMHKEAVQKLVETRGRAVSRCRDKNLPGKYVPTDGLLSAKTNFQKLVHIKLYTSKLVKKITECNYLFTF